MYKTCIILTIYYSHPHVAKTFASYWITSWSGSGNWISIYYWTVSTHIIQSDGLYLVLTYLFMKRGIILKWDKTCYACHGHLLCLWG